MKEVAPEPVVRNTRVNADHLQTVPAQDMEVVDEYVVAPRTICGKVSQLLRIMGAKIVRRFTFEDWRVLDVNAKTPELRLSPYAQAFLC